MTKEGRDKLEKKFKVIRTQKIGYLEQQIQIFQSDLDRLKEQLQEVIKMNEGDNSG
jgi:SMC interacting uncharacterized protein involved in chromosome segregation